MKPTNNSSGSSSQERLLPVANRTESFWLTERDPLLQNAQTTKSLPRTADVVIVGSGLTGAMMSHHLYADARIQGRKPSMVMLEAGEVCGSATARNGGHCKPLTYLGYRASATKHNPEISNQVLEFEEAALGQYADLVREEDMDCDMHVTRAFDVFFSEADAREGKKDYEARLKAWPQSIKNGDVRAVDDPRELEQITGIKGGVWGISYPAGHLWPYKLATSLIRKSVQKGMNLQTHTPALSLDRAPDGTSWVVTTARGSITAKSVVVASNAYTSSFLPEFKELIFPVRGAACSITPAPSHSPGGLPGPLKYSYGIRFGPGEVDYMIPRQGRGRIPGAGDRSIILGGAKGIFTKDLHLWYNNKNDNEQMPGVREYFEEYMKKYFVGWNGNEHGNVDHVWSGILGYSSDLLPYIGQVPDRTGVFICAGFTGHGMPRIPGCTRALSGLVASHLAGGVTPHSQSMFESALPKPYWMTRERFESRVNLIKGYMGQEKKTQIAPTVSDEAVNLRARAKL